MVETLFQNLSDVERREVIEVAELRSNQQAYFLEKDIWIVATLAVLFESPFANHLIFKGGTSLSKVWHAIRRFSEDVDVTYDIRAFAPDFVSGAGEEALPPNRSQEKRWTRAIRYRLAEWVRDEAVPTIAEGLSNSGFFAHVECSEERLFVQYQPLFEIVEIAPPKVIVEFGARSTGEPHITKPVVCDAAEFLPDLGFPEAQPNTMLAERTFWEKATAVHVFCYQRRLKAKRLSRHWYDLACLDKAGIAEDALADRVLALAVARHKTMFFPHKDANGERISYEDAVSGQLQMVPAGGAFREVLNDDYEAMMQDGMLFDENESFDAIMERCGEIEARANSILSRTN